MKKIDGRELINIAIDVEREGGRFYRAVYETCPNEKVKILFKVLATFEEEHVEKLEKIYDEMIKDDLHAFFTSENKDEEEELGAMEDMFITSKNTIFSKAKTFNNALKSKTPLEIIVFAMSIEQATIDYYKSLQKVIKTGNKSILITLINEEKDHLKSLINLRSMLSKK